MAAKRYFQLMSIEADKPAVVKEMIFDWIRNGFRQVEFEGNRSDVFIRHKKVCAYIKNPLVEQQGNHLIIKGDLVPGGPKADVCKDAMINHKDYKLNAVFWPADGSIVKIVLEKIQQETTA